VRAHVSAGVVIYGDVVNELRAKIKVSEKIVFALKVKAVMTCVPTLIWWPL